MFTPTWTEALQAITARRQGVFDDPVLLKFGPLLPSVDDDVRAIKKAALEAYGFVCGDRDPQWNTDYVGRFMVVECPDDAEGPTRDGANGPWCVVSDDLSSLIDQAFDVFADQ